ncbi:MAG: CoB--CoM heterodisulfide reductase iron-sulfur subunit A family protein [Candidatus Methanofastidiosa archaeon]|nr:CoB--CoM heterodisulfide reductase iron-sulfur subunit A family protein [Candidatus Methanofastidiosa archaeon]
MAKPQSKKNVVDDSPKIGVYVCHCGTNIAGSVNIEEVVEFSKKLKNVSVVREHMYLCSEQGQNIIKEDIKKEGINRVVAACCSPRTHEEIFRRTLNAANLNKYLYEQVNIRDQCSWPHYKDKENATIKAKQLVKSGVYRASELESLEDRKLSVLKSSLVIGGGISGINAALDLAHNGYKVYIVDRNPSIGGKMAQLDKTFPTNDCSACILSPMMVDVSNTSNIELLTYSEVEDVSGHIGNYHIVVRKKQTSVDWEKCNGCGDCSIVCPVKVDNEFNCNMDKRKAIYIQFQQAIPMRAVVDKDKCVKCKLCEKRCKVGAIDISKNEDEFVEFDVGSIVLTTGYDLFDPNRKAEYSYDHPNVITSLELERMMCASGPTKGEILRPSDNRKPHTISFIQCVGSRDEKTNDYCSRICCTYTIKHARLLKEKYPDMDIYMHYIDLRCFGKGYEEYYRIAREKGVKFIRGRISQVDSIGDRLEVSGDDDTLGEQISVVADLVVLAVAMEPSKGAKRLANLLNISTDRTGFYKEIHPKLKPVNTDSDGIFIAGACQGPKEIPDAVSQGKAAASAASSLMSKGEIDIEPLFAQINEELCSRCRTCETLCSYKAIKYTDTEKMEVDIALCKGCGVCSAACPSGAIKANHFTSKQVRMQILALTEGLQ